MSQENVEVVRAAFAAWNARDMDAFRDTYDPDVIVRAPEGWPEPGPFVGREAVMRQWEQQRETFDADALEPITDFLHAADRVVVRFIWRGVGHGPESSMELTGVYTFRKGKVFGVEFFWDHTQALEAVGLSEEEMSQENVEVMRAAMEAFNRRDAKGFGACLASDAEIVPVRAALEGTVFRGPDAAAQYCAAVDESWENLRWEVEGFRDGDGWVIALGRIRGGGRGSGAAIDARAGWVARFSEGLVTSFHTYADRSEALEAVGLSE